jgi:DNA polymerase III gamma/tau subunit
MPLATDYRPETIKELHGNTALKQALSSKMKSDNKPHVYLFTGQKGCGKTTLARIVSNALKCHEAEFSEVDASDESGGVSAVRALKRLINYEPMVGDVRVWFIDECHKLTKAAQEAFLKMLEEPPKHAYFILATTDPQKLLPTFKDRCVTFEVKPLTDDEMINLLDGIVEAEEKEVPQDIIEYIVGAANGLPRQALQMLERVIDLPTKQMLASAQQTAEVEVQTISLCRVLLKPKPTWKEVTAILATVQGEPESIRYAILGYCNAILMKADNPRAYAVMSCFTEPYYNLAKAGLTLSCYEATH